MKASTLKKLGQAFFRKRKWRVGKECPYKLRHQGAKKLALPVVIKSGDFQYIKEREIFQIKWSRQYLSCLFYLPSVHVTCTEYIIDLHMLLPFLEKVCLQKTSITGSSKNYFQKFLIFPTSTSERSQQEDLWVKQAEHPPWKLSDPQAFRGVHLKTMVPKEWPSERWQGLPESPRPQKKVTHMPWGKGKPRRQ